MHNDSNQPGILETYWGPKRLTKYCGPAIFNSTVYLKSDQYK